jgi:hypothetical protein
VVRTSKKNPAAAEKGKTIRAGSDHCAVYETFILKLRKRTKSQSGMKKPTHEDLKLGADSD